MIIKTKEDLIEQLEWRPKSYIGRVGKEYVYYEKNWYCKENSTIHNNMKQVINCKYCCGINKSKAIEILENYENN